MKTSSIKIIFLLVITLFSLHTSAIAQKKSKKDKKKDQTTEVKGKDKKKTIKELTKKSKTIDGLFTIYQDTITGKTYMAIKKEQLNKDFIYFSQIADGVNEGLGLRTVRGAYKRSKIFKIEKHFNKIEFITQNTSFYFDEDSALSKSSTANISEGVMASIKIEASDDEKGIYLIASDPLFTEETFEQIKAPKFPKQSPTAFTLGKLSKDKSKIKRIKNYPENTSVLSHYVYSAPSVLNRGSEAVSDGRNVTIKVEHTLIKVPENDYKPRYDDPRIGYFLTQVTDMTSASPTPYRDLIHRWNLIKKDPEAAISEPKQPIVWWMEKSTPVEFRETIKEAVLEWNKAFEKAGFKNAMVVKMQPDDAEWDAGDIRYNVLRWTSSPNPPFGGYGPSFVNPRTGEILGADIMLEYVYHTNRVKYDRLYSTSASAEENFLEHNNSNYSLCSMGHVMQENSLYGHIALTASGANENEMKGMRREAMKELIMHEVGHTLGLNHNMKASQLFSPEQLSNPEFIKGKCLTGSVMDYSGINVVADQSKQGQYFSTSVGPYDVWAIEFGYTPVKSEAELLKIASRSNQPELIFGNDADDMRYPGKAIDPRVMTGDMSNDQITFSINQMEIANKLMSSIKSKFSKEGQSYQELRQAYAILRRNYARAGDIISRFIGGVYVDRSVEGQDPTKKPYTPVAYEDQKRAMKAMEKYVFAPDAYKVPNDLYNYLAMQRRGFNFYRNPEDPKIHDHVLNSQKTILRHLLHHNTLQRITDSELYGNTYKLSEFMTDLNNAIFKADAAISVNTFRQNLQLEYVNQLLGILKQIPSKDKKGSYNYQAKSMALSNLKKIKSMVSVAAGNELTKAHRDHIKTLISNNLEEIK